MREICTSGSTRGQQGAFRSPAVLLYWPVENRRRGVSRVTHDSDVAR
jgi:hypothetical protein